MANDPNYEKEFFDGIFADVIKLDYALLKTRYFLELSVFTQTEEDSKKIRAYYELAKEFTKAGLLHGFSSYGNKSRRWVETVVIPQDFIDFYMKRNNTPTDSDISFEDYSEENYILKLTGVEIKMAKKGKDNDATLLLKSLLKKEETDAWKYYDDIFEEWGYHSDNLKKIHRNKVLFAVNRVNDLIAQEIQVKDFIEHQKSKVRINPKYRKVS